MYADMLFPTRLMSRLLSTVCLCRQILTPFLLRRLKADVTLEVPPKREIYVYAPLTLKQETLYSAIINRTISKILGQDKVLR